MNDPTLFAAGALFTQDYLVEGIRGTAHYASTDVTALRAKLAAILAGFPHASKPNEATTESDLVWPVLAALGWEDWLTQQNLSATGRLDVPDGLLFIDAAAKAKANTFADEAKRYQFGAAVIESKRWGRALDRAEGRTGADKDTPSTQLLRYLRRIDDLTNGDLRWGLLTNGAKWRLYFAGARSTIDDYLELDLARIMGVESDLLDTGITDEDRDHWLAVFAAMFSRSAFERATDKAPSFHDTARKEAGFYEERVAKNLSELVFNRLYPTLGKAVAHSAPADTPLEDVRQATLILLYRLLFVLYAEDRGLLPVKDTRFDDYALRVARLDVGKRKDAGDTFSHIAKNYWNRFADLAEMIDKGDPSVGLPPYNGGLFNAAQTPLLGTITLPDDVMAEAIDILSWERRDGQRRYINYRDLSVQQLGSIYERLLEFELTRDPETGAVDVRPNIFARKNSGSYYTPDDLVLLILDETLQPLIDDALDAFKAALAQAKPKDSDDHTLTQLQKVDPAKAITRLRICDPAMGSGHFLVSLVDRLTNHTLDAIAEAQVLVKARFPDLDYESPVAEEIRKVRGTIRHNAEDANWAVSEEQLDDPQLVKRMVLKRCVYGADKNPMAVELAKVALWLHTFTVGAPLSFIDHHLAAGDSLFGLWVRDAIDKAGKGGELFLHEPLSNAQRQAAVMRTIESLTDAEVAEAHRSAEMWHDVEAQTGPLDGFVSFMHALDWLDLPKTDRPLVMLWLDGMFGEPIPIARGKREPEGAKVKPEELERFTAIWLRARDLIEEERFLNWQITFPGVWSNWASAAREGGFDAVVGNPPWDRFEFEELPWFAARDAAIATEPLKSKRKAMISALKTRNPSLLAEFNAAQARQTAAAKIVKSGKIYSELNSGKLNIYKIFVERAISLIKPDGMVGLLTPIGIGTDHNIVGFLKKITSSNRLKSFVAFENKRKWLFSDVHAEDQPTIFCVGGPTRTFAQFTYGVKLHKLPTDPDAPKPVVLGKETLAKVNPTTGTMPIFRSMTDLLIVAKIYESSPVLIEGTGRNEIPAWPIKYRQMINMTSRSEGFRTATMLAEHEGAWPAKLGEFDSPVGKWLRLYEGKMVSIFNHRYAGVQNRSNSVSGQGQTIHSSEDQLSDPTFLPTPRYWILESDAAPDFPWAIGFNDVCNTNNARSVLSAIVPSGAYGNTLPLLTWTSAAATDAALLQANLASIPTDYVARQKIQSRHLNKYILAQLPVIPPAAYSRQFGPQSAADIVKMAVLELTYTAQDMAPFARDMGHVDGNGKVLPPFIWDEERRLHLRAKLDALYFILYGVFDPADPAQSRDDVRYIYSTFPIVERQETERWGSYRSRDLALAYINTLMAGQPDAVVAG